MDQLQDQLEANYPQYDIQILGVNQAGFESGNPSITAGRDLPWLQDTVAANVWSAWSVTYRDVVVLDGNNEVFGVFNVTANNLALPTNYDALRQLFLDAAGTL
jgi:hypothetical protein